MALAAAVLAWGAVGAAQTSAEFAQHRYEDGLRLFDQHEYDRALTEFRASLVLYSSPNTQLGIARALRELGRLDEAVTEFERTVRLADTQPGTGPRLFESTRDTAVAEARALEPRVGRISLAVRAIDVTLRVHAGAREIALVERTTTAVVMPGRIRVRAEASGYQPWQRDVDVAAGQLVEINVALDPVPAPAPIAEPPPAPVIAVAPSHRIEAIGWASVAIGGAGVLLAAAFASTANARSGDLARCGNCPRYAALVQEGQTWEALTNVSLGVGLTALIIGGAVLVFGRAPRVPAMRALFTGNALLLEGRF